ncbi:hypothetical protein HYX06_06770 [Candidatus Woesearchaeota archaeon]|nr:hypothetical protein [Candidatus Woesearchaeota archaeon]
MRLHHQFDLNTRILNSFGKDKIALPPYLIEDLITKLSKEGYTVLKSSAYFMGIPQSIIVVKEFTGPFVSQFASKIRNDFDSVSRKLGIRELFE